MQLCMAGVGVELTARRELQRLVQPASFTELIEFLESLPQIVMTGILILASMQMLRVLGLVLVSDWWL